MLKIIMDKCENLCKKKTRKCAGPQDGKIVKKLYCFNVMCAHSDTLPLKLTCESTCYNIK